MKSFAKRNTLVAVLATVASCLICTEVCFAWSLASQPVEGILLLKNSNILRGKVQKQGKHYFVYLPNGKLRVPEQQVETVCENLTAAFEYRKEKYGGSSIDSHLALAGWCLRHELFDQAEAELSAADAIDEGHPRLKMLRRQLTQSLIMAEHQRRQQATTAEPEPEPDPIDPAKLEKAPKWARALFVRQIQPLMVHSCATGGCHQSPTETEFHLSRLALDGVGHPGVTLRNLVETLDQIDWDAAEQSELLARARKAHGGEKNSLPLPPHKLHVLQSWVNQLAEAHQQETQLKTLPEVTEVVELPVTPDLQLNGPQLAEPQPPVGVRTASYQARDPFDPAVFNDRYASERPAAKPPIAELPESSVPHVLAPSEPTPIPLPATE